MQKNEADESATGSADRAAPLIVSMQGLVRTSIIGIFLILLTGALYFAQDVLVPIALAFFIAVLLSPIVRFLQRFGIMPGITATVIVVALLTLIGVGGYSLSGPISGWIDNAPRIGQQIEEKLSVLRSSFGFVAQVNEQVSELGGKDDPDVQQVVMKQPGILNRAATGMPAIATKLGLTLVLLLFLLAAGDLFREKLVKVLPTMKDKKRAVHISRDIEREVSRYLLTIAFINVAYGGAVGIGMAFLGMPNPVLWGVLAFFLAFIPYLGALVGCGLVFVVALVSFPTIGYALLAPAIYAVVAIIEGQFLTPMIVGRRLEMNAVAILISVAFWGWLWGIIGALMAVPILVMIKVFSDHVEGLEPVGQFLSTSTHKDSSSPEK
ncbi:AI-2E family transporter [Terrihabitans rhizophilus]|uniref:AI-2E family transporter n=1 Tax=Terrihabitans rhizophilus TaxID=3092662 RepID=A0ABU4RLW2_9HYPH|nr:AI-2E family transporter [Terrihabitans sp. PJ23]MDX6805218.1 AI-2E family transporter [Terrihabitans sp. PJ23]